MSALLIVAVLALLQPSGLAQNAVTPAPGPAWSAYVSKDGRFTVSLPALPRVDVVTFRTPLGDLRFTFHQVLIGDAAYIVAYSDYSADVIRKYTADHILANARQGVLFRVGGKLSSERKIAVGGFPARDIVIEGVNHGVAVARVRLILAGRRLYQVMVALPNAQASPATVTRFVTSFRITGSSARPRKNSSGQ